MSAPTLVAPMPVLRRTCCCCIPARAGVVIFALLGLLGGVAVTAGGIYTLVRQHTTGSKVALIIQIVAYCLLAVVSLFGLIGACTRRIGLIQAFLIILILHLLGSIGTGIYAIRLVFLQGSEYNTQCVGTSEDPVVAKSCQNSFTILKVFVITVYIGAWLIQLWATVVVGKYKNQLVDEERARKVFKASETW